jgi:mono/diheme cytochrome c family protein
MRVSLLKTKTACLLALCALAGATAALPRAARQEVKAGGVLPEGARYLPAGAGREIMLKACVQCHDLKNTVSQRKTADGWRRTVNEMIWRGTPLVGDEAGVVARYLAESFGPDKPVPDAVKKIFAGEKGEEAGNKKVGTP